MRPHRRGPAEGAGEEREDEIAPTEAVTKPVEAKRASVKSVPAERPVNDGPVEAPEDGPDIQAEDREREILLAASEALNELDGQAEIPTEQTKAFAGDTSAWQTRTARTRRGWQVPQGRHDTLSTPAAIFEGAFLSFVGAAVVTGLTAAFYTGSFLLAAIGFGIPALIVCGVVYALFRAMRSRGK